MMASICWYCEVSQRWQGGQPQHCWNCGRFTRGPQARDQLEYKRCRLRGYDT